MTGKEEELYHRIFHYKEVADRIKDLDGKLNTSPKLVAAYGAEASMARSTGHLLNASEQQLSRKERIMLERAELFQEIDPVKDLSRWLIEQNRTIDDTLVRGIAQGMSLREWERKYRVSKSTGMYAGRRIKRIVQDYIQDVTERGEKV